MHAFLNRRLAEPLRKQLARGVSPEALARATVTGAVLGVFPFLGTTTVLCTLAASLGGLNQPVVQAANYAVSALQVLLIPVFVRAGEHLFGMAPVPLDVRLLPGQFLADTPAFLRMYGLAGLAGGAAWALAALPAAPVLLYLFRRGFRIMVLRLETQKYGATPSLERNS